MADGEWTRPHYGITHFSFWRGRQWSTISTLRPRLHIVKFWDKGSDHYFSPREQVVRSIKEARALGEAWATPPRGQVIEGRCPTCGQTTKK